MDIVPRHRHLEGLRLWTRGMRLHEDPFGEGAKSVNGYAGEKREPGRETANGDRVNGYR